MSRKTSKTDKAQPSTSRKLNEELTEMFIIVPPDGGWGWVVVVAAFLSFFVADGVYYTFGVFLEEMSRSLETTTSQISMIGATMACVFCALGPFTAALINKFGYRKIGILGSILGTIACILTSYSNTAQIMYLTFGVMGGAGFGMIYLPALVVVGFYFERWRALATGIAVCGSGVGGIVLAPLISMLLNQYGWRNTFRIISVMSLTCILFASLYRPITPMKATVKDDKISITNISAEESVQSDFLMIYPTTSAPTTSEVVALSAITLYRSLKLGDSKLSTVDEEGEKRTRFFTLAYWKRKCCNICHHKGPPMRPLYREDIFYSGSVMFLPPEQRGQSISTHNKMFSLTSASLVEHISLANATVHDIYEKPTCCPQSMTHTLMTMLNFKLLKEPSFILLSLSTVFTTVGMFIPYMFIKDRAVRNGINESDATWLLSTINAANTVGRIVCGIVTTAPNIKATVVSYLCLISGGFATALSGLNFDVMTQHAYAGYFGFSMACISALRPIIAVEILGLENLTNAIGIVLMFMGFSVLVGIAISGYLFDYFGNYVFPFYFAGVTIIIGGVLIIPIGAVSKWEKRRAAAKL